jgi:isopentenyl diphosphate isomerase/L-lactate dehydrogenase-like FMN-dependent dehydrogenase
VLSAVDLHELAREGHSPRRKQLDVLRDRDYTARVVEAARSAGVDRLVLAVDRPVRGHRPRMADPELPPGVAIASHLGEEQAPRRAAQDKGVLTGRGALEPLARAPDSVVVSNHGARHLDGAVCTAAPLAGVARSVATPARVLVDGGVRTGADVLRALAVGASAVLIGRP